MRVHRVDAWEPARDWREGKEGEGRRRAGRLVDACQARTGREQQLVVVVEGDAVATAEDSGGTKRSSLAGARRQRGSLCKEAIVREQHAVGAERDVVDPEQSRRADERRRPGGRIDRPQRLVGVLADGIEAGGLRIEGQTAAAGNTHRTDWSTHPGRRVDTIERAALAARSRAAEQRRARQGRIGDAGVDFVAQAVAVGIHRPGPETEIARVAGARRRRRFPARGWPPAGSCRPDRRLRRRRCPSRPDRHSCRTGCRCRRSPRLPGPGWRRSGSCHMRSRRHPRPDPPVRGWCVKGQLSQPAGHWVGELQKPSPSKSNGVGSAAQGSQASPMSSKSASS